MGCPCGGEIAQASADGVMAINAVEDAVNDCCDRVIEYYDMTAANIGQGLEACCTAWADAGATTFTVPGYTTQVACPDGTTVPCDIPPRTGVTDGWAGTYQWGIQQQIDSQNNAAALYNQQYQDWLAAYNNWQNLQILPQIIAMVAQIAAITRMYDLWSDYLGKTNQIMCHMTDVVFPEVCDEFMTDISGNYTDHVTELGANFTEVLGLVNGNLEWHCEKADVLCECYFATGRVLPDGTQVEYGYSAIEKQHASNMAQNLSNVAVAAQWSAQDLKTQLMEFKAESELTFDSFRDNNFGEIELQIRTLIEKGADICDYLNTCGQELVDNYRNNQQDDVNMLLEQQVLDAKDCLVQIQEAIADADTKFEEQMTLHAAYMAEEAQTSPQIIEQARAILECGDVSKDCYQDARNCAIDFKDRYEVTWQVNEEALATKIMEMACRLANGLEEQYEFKKGLSEECLEHWQDHYADCDAQLAEGILSEAKLLYGTRKDTFDTFVMHQEEFFSCWNDHYKPLEHEYSSELLTKAAERVCVLHNQIDSMCEEADEFLDCFRNYMQEPEKELLPKVMLAGITACEQQIDSYEGLDDLFDKLFQNWCEEIMPCDLDDISQLCGVLEKRDLGCEVDDNNQCAMEIADAAKDCFLNFGLDCEKEYLQELCDMMAYEPKFCELEDRALLHVRRQADIARENLLRTSNRFCMGDMTEQLCKLESDRVRLESQAISAANRFERWWEVRENERRHRYKFDMTAAVSALAGLAMQGFNQSTAGYDILLTQLHARLSRSYSYLTNANQAGNSAAGSAAQGVIQSLNSAQTGHYFSDQYLRIKQEADAQAQAMLLRAQEQTRIGQNYGNLAMNAQAQAETTARDGIQDGLNAMSHGRQFKQLALSGSTGASQDSQNAQSLGLQHIDRGHFWIQEGRLHKDQAWMIVRDAINNAQQSINQGHDTLNQTLAFERHRDELIQRCRNNGMEASAQQLQIMQVGEQKMERALASAEAALARALDLLRMGQQQDNAWISGYGNLASLAAPAAGAYNGIVASGHNLMQLSSAMSQVGHSHKTDMCSKICDSIRDREISRMNQMMGFNALAANTGQLASQFGGGLANSVEGLLGSIQGLAGQPPSLLGPAPGGNQINTSGGFGGTTYGGGNNPLYASPTIPLLT